MPHSLPLGDLLIVGFDGYDPTPQILERIRAGRAGGIILFDRNVQGADQIGALCADLQAARAAVSDTPLIIAIDQEGGSVARLRGAWPELPGNMALGAIDDETVAEDVGRALAGLLLPLGITLNLAPVLDVASSPENPGIGVRSFGADAERVAALGCALIRGMQAAGVAATAKHFPGMGDAHQDAHDELPIVQTPLRELQVRHMAPFVAAMDAGVAAVMTAHCAYPHFDRMTRLPATVNRRLWQQVVRREFGYEGAIISDCLEMKGFTRWLTPETGAQNAVMAGVDQLLVCHTPAVQDAVYDALIDAGDRGLIAEHILREACARSLALRTFAPSGDGAARDAGPVGDAVAQRALTALRADGWPCGNITRLTLLVPDAFQQTEVETAASERFDPLVAALEAGGCAVSVGPLHSEVTVPPCDAILLLTANAHLHPQQADAARQALARASVPAAVVAVRNPFDADLFPDRPVVLTYSDTPPAQRALAAWVLGQGSAAGTAPVPLQSVS